MKNLSSTCVYCIALIAIGHWIELRAAEELDQGVQSVVNQEDSTGVPDDGGGSKSVVLSRKRRFLQFPEGSSFQVVYDQTIPIIGSTLLFTVGVTCALAWQLPSISLLEIFKMLQSDPTLALGRRRDENVTGTILIDTNSTKSHFDMDNKHSYYYTANSPGAYPVGSTGTKNMLSYYQQPGLSNRVNYYTSGSGPTWPPNTATGGPDFGKMPPNFLSPYNWTRNDWSNVVNRYLQTWVRNHPPNFQFGRRRFYPVFGKRSIDAHTHPEDKFFLNHHRSTRHDLYQKIEKFLEAQGKHGHHCVLRALCESGQRRDANEPESFLREILKAVFSLPSTHETPEHHVHRRYDEAHAHLGDCAERYSFCADSIWSDSFIF
ncbi:conserved hypothetical protein [Culex quinquefasciatus]|uniref:Uncharacterized protein n=1 Tax=Culex quinquefasciatus TaxID=7176 RepID=B0X5R2_CULQU|nr:conserved hypothetical protein [Culex quinquefasciatus]|eukprot:XP_001864984.1 conserved hypothetical protein [Culex quinquefasciatus]